MMLVFSFTFKREYNVGVFFPLAGRESIVFVFLSRSYSADEVNSPGSFPGDLHLSKVFGSNPTCYLDEQLVSQVRSSAIFLLSMFITSIFVANSVIKNQVCGVFIGLTQLTFEVH